ncbi:MAG: YciI family protein [Sediminibacterium sp.]|nr:YciI family protein [Sediminibacterium sp.]
MRAVFILLVFFMPVLSGVAQKAAKPYSKQPSEEMNIRQYYFVLLTKGPNRSQDSATTAAIMKGHLSNMSVMYNAGKLKVAGPFAGNGDWQGIFIFDCKDQKEVEALLATDPAIKAGRLNYIIQAWYTAPQGSFLPGLPRIPEK